MLTFLAIRTVNSVVFGTATSAAPVLRHAVSHEIARWISLLFAHADFCSHPLPKAVPGRVAVC